MDSYSISQQFLLLLSSPNPLMLVVWVTVYFLALYTTFASMTWAMARAVSRPIETRLVSGQQLRMEMLNSLRSILLFGVGILIPWGLVRLGFVGVEGNAGIVRIILECVVLLLWNDLHFYAIHRLLHEKFKKLHVAHHKSVAATPFAAYSMSAPEALLLGSVMPLAMLTHDFSVQSLMFLPVWSIGINTLSHSNCDLFVRARSGSLYGFIRHHQEHHSRYNGDYSFFFSHLDKWFGTTQEHLALNDSSSLNERENS